MNCLRILSAFETELDSLASNIIKLTSEALDLEDKLPGSSNSLLLNLENKGVLKMIVAKLQGKLVLDLLQEPYCRAAEKIIHHIETLLKLH